MLSLAVLMFACFVGVQSANETRKAYVRGANARAILLDHAKWIEAWTKEEADLIWLRKHNRMKKYQLDTGRQIYNKLPTSAPLTDKSELAMYVNAYEEKMGLMEDSRIPFTYPLNSEEDGEQLKSDPVKRRRISEGVWILKLTSESMGRGIDIVAHGDKWLESGNYTLLLRRLRRGSTYVFQKYIRNPLLLEGRKSELRLYWAVLSVEPLLAVVYNGGQVRLNSMRYIAADFGNPLRHLTNIFQQRTHPSYKELEAQGALKWTIEKWRDYLHTAHNISYPRIDTLTNRMKENLVRALNATGQELLRKGQGHSRFELFGADFILDDNLNVYLTEVQYGPGLSISSTVKAKTLKSVLTGVVDMAYEVMQRRRKGKDLENLNTIEGSGFEWLVNEARTPAYYYKAPQIP